jgi:hypothetical protein
MIGFAIQPLPIIVFEYTLVKIIATFYMTKLLYLLISE